MSLHPGKVKSIIYFKNILIWLSARIFFVRRVSVFILVASIAGCAIVDRGTPVPRELTAIARVSGFEGIRYSIDTHEHELRKEFNKAIEIAKGGG